ncbi:uroporphyrinogen decarboxylase family protein [Chloroflexota bacterium]
MNSRERVLKAINHQEPDRVPIDLGGSIVTGIMAGALVRLRQHLGLTGPVKVIDVFQMLGEVTPDLVERFHIDMLPVQPEAIFFDHLANRDYKPWTLFDGTEVLMPGNFDVTVSPNSDWELHEDSDPQKPVIARMPQGGFYFDKMDITDWDPNFKPPSIESLKNSDWRRLTDDVLSFLQAQAQSLRTSTDKALVLTNWGEATLGPPQVGSIPEWLILLVTEPAYVQELMDLGTEIAIDNLKLYKEALGDTIDIIHLDGYDYGAQHSEMFSPTAFEQFHKPCYKAQCDWIHQNTTWKTAKHCCGSIPDLIEPMIRAGIDILNPVQTSATNMDMVWLKETFGDRVTFWGGGVDTQNVFAFKTPEEVKADVVERLRVFGPGGGFIWNPIHNIQYTVSPENIVAALETVLEYGRYPVAQ